MTAGALENAQNVTMAQTASGVWEVRVSGTDEVIGSIRKLGDRYGAFVDEGEALDEYDSPELAMFGIVGSR